jgi:hypothetical protein
MDELTLTPFAQLKGFKCGNAYEKKTCHYHIGIIPDGDRLTREVFTAHAHELHVGV